MMSLPHVISRQMIGEIGTNDSLSKNEMVNFNWKVLERVHFEKFTFISIFYKNNVNIYYLFGRFGAKITFKDLF